MTAWNGLQRPALHGAEAAFERGLQRWDDSSLDRATRDAPFLDAARLAFDDLRLYRWSRTSSLLAARSLSRLLYPEQAEPHYALARRWGRLGVEAQRDRVQGFLRANQNEKAAALGREALADSPDDPVLLRYLTIAEWNQDRLPEAREVAERLARTREGQVDGLDLLASIARAAERREEAVAAARAILEVDPDLKRYRDGAPNFWLEFCNDLIQTHQSAEARTHLRREIKPYSPPVFFDYLGAAEKDLNHPDAAEEAWRNSIRRDPTRYNPWLQIGRLAKDRKRYPEAIDALEHAVALAPQNMNANIQLEQAYRLQGRVEDARRQLERIEAIKKVAPPPPQTGGMGPSS